jgi:hypothetical protein
MKNKEKKIKLTSEQLKALEGMSKVRLPVDMMAAILGISKSTLERLTKGDAAVREAISRGRANASGLVRNTLFRLATEKVEVVEKTVEGKNVKTKTYTREPDMRAMELWVTTQEGFKRTDKLEVTGPDGGPIETTELSKKERAAAIKALDKKLRLTEDE